MKCTRCDDLGLVTLERPVVDRFRDGSSQTRTLTEAYRCDCPAGARVSAAFRMAPPDPIHLLTAPDVQGARQAIRDQLDGPL